MKKYKQILVSLIIKKLEENELGYLVLTSQKDIDQYQKDVDLILYDLEGFALSRKITEEFCRDNNLSVVKEWTEAGKFFSVILDENNNYFAIDLMLGFSHGGWNIVDVSAINTLKTYMPDNEKITFIKELKKLNYYNSYFLKKASLFDHAKQRFNLFLNKVSNFRKANGGIFVVFLGPDGAGKTTIINQVIEKIQAGRLLSVVKYHLRAPILKPKQKTVKKTYAQSNPQEQHQRSVFMSIIKMFYILLVYNIVYLQRILPHLKSSKIVIHDRYFYDVYTDPKRFGYSYTDKFAKIIGQFIPKPDIIFILTADAEIIVKRKDDLTLNQAENLVSKYRRIDSKHFKAKLIHIDTNNDIDHVSNEVVSNILNGLRDK